MLGVKDSIIFGVRIFEGISLDFLHPWLLVEWIPKGRTQKTCLI